MFGVMASEPAPGESLLAAMVHLPITIIRAPVNRVRHS
jgi:hypothetical protein